MAKAKNPTLDALKKASKGLLFPSKTDAPDGDKLTHEKLLKLTGAAAGTAVEETTLAGHLKAQDGQRPGSPALPSTRQCLRQPAHALNCSKSTELPCLPADARSRLRHLTSALLTPDDPEVADQSRSRTHATRGA